MNELNGKRTDDDLLGFISECGKCKSGTKRLNLNKFCKRDYGKYKIECKKKKKE